MLNPIRANFESHAAAAEYIQTRGAFKKWDPRTVLEYANHGFEPTSAGDVTLRCRPEFEATVYPTYPLIWSRLSEVAAPTLIIVGEDSPATGSEDFGTTRPVYEAMHRRIRHSTLQVGEGGGHFWPFEQPGLMADAIAAALASAPESRL